MTNQQQEINVLKEELQLERFTAEYQRAGGIFTEPDPLTGQTKQGQVYELAKPLLEKGQSLSEVVAGLADSENYQGYFSDEISNPPQPAGQTVSRAAFRSGKVDFEDVISGKVRVR